MRVASGSANGSLLRQWITKMVAAYSSKVSWPLQSLKLDDQLAFAKVRAGSWKQLLRSAARHEECSAAQHAAGLDIATRLSKDISKPGGRAAQHNMYARAFVRPELNFLLPQKRIQRDACAPQYAITFDDVTKAASTLTVSSASGNCDAAVMIASAAVTGANPNPRVSCPPFLLPATTCSSRFLAADAPVPALEVSNSWVAGAGQRATAVSGDAADGGLQQDFDAGHRCRAH